MPVGWQYQLHKASDMSFIGDLKTIHDRTLNVDLNRSGDASGWIPNNDPLCNRIRPMGTAVSIQYTDVFRNRYTFWSGLINGRNRDLEARKCSFTAVGWFDRLMKLNLQEKLTFTNVDAGEIISVLIGRARILDPALYISMGTVEVSRIRTITYEIDQSIGQAILDLAGLESGIDFEIDPITRKLNIMARKGVVRPKLKFTYIGDGNGENSNLSNVVEDVTGSTLVNDIRPRGRSDSGLAVDSRSQEEYGVYMEAPSLTDVVELNILNSYGNAELVYRSQPRTTYTITPKPSTHGGVPRLFRDFDLGDTGFLTARRDSLDVAGMAVRIFGVSLAIQDNGTELLSNVQTSVTS